MSDPFRADAAKVFRELRDHGPGRAVDLAHRCFPVATDPDDPSYKALTKRGWRRVIDSIVWMRHQGVVLSAVPSEEGAVFHLGAVTAEVSRHRVTRREEGLGDGMDIWHEGNR